MGEGSTSPIPVPYVVRVELLNILAANLTMFPPFAQLEAVIGLYMIAVLYLAIAAHTAFSSPAFATVKSREPTIALIARQRPVRIAIAV